MDLSLNSVDAIKEHSLRNKWVKKADLSSESSDSDRESESFFCGDSKNNDYEREWVKVKNKEKGESVLLQARMKSPSYLFQAIDSSAIECTRIPNVPSDITAVILRNVLSVDECNRLVDSVPFSGSGFMDVEAVRELYIDRVVERYCSDDPEFSALIEDRIHDYIPRIVDGMHFTGISPEWRYLRYERGGHQGCHVDGREERGNLLTYLGFTSVFSKNTTCFVLLLDSSLLMCIYLLSGGASSRLTVQMYLNKCDVDYEGGEILFLKDDLSQNLKYKPNTGDCILFYQEKMDNTKTPLHLLHKACTVLSGTKYALRSVVEYTHDMMTCEHTTTDMNS